MNSVINTVYMSVGLPASGKTTFGRELSQVKSAAFLDIDISTETLVQAAMTAMEMNPNDRDSENFKTLFRAPIYDTLFDTARANIGHTDVVITGPFTFEFNNPHWIHEITEKLGSQCLVKAYYLHCTESELRARMIQRNNPRDAGKLNDWDKFRTYYKEQRAPLFPHTAINTSQLDQEGRRKIIQAI